MDMPMDTNMDMDMDMPMDTNMFQPGQEIPEEDTTNQIPIQKELFDMNKNNLNTYLTNQIQEKKNNIQLKLSQLTAKQDQLQTITGITPSYDFVSNTLFAKNKEGSIQHNVNNRDVVYKLPSLEEYEKTTLRLRNILIILLFIVSIIIIYYSDFSKQNIIFIGSVLVINIIVFVYKPIQEFMKFFFMVIRK